MQSSQKRSRSPTPKSSGSARSSRPQSPITIFSDPASKDLQPISDQSSFKGRIFIGLVFSLIYQLLLAKGKDINANDIIYKIIVILFLITIIKIDKENQITRN